MAVDIIARAMAAEASSGGKDVDYGSVTNKPQINGITLEGNKTTSDLGIGEIIELKGTKENPIELANIGEPGIYKISGYIKSLLTSLAADIGNGIILEVAKTNDAISQHYWEGNSAFRMKVRVAVSGIPFTENFHDLSQNGDIEYYNSIDAFSLITSLTLSRYLGRGYMGKVLLTDLKTTDKNSLINAINELVDTKQDKLTAGSGITIENNVISALGGGSTGIPSFVGTEDSPITLTSDDIIKEPICLISGYITDSPVYNNRDIRNALILYNLTDKDAVSSQTRKTQLIYLGYGSLANNFTAFSCYTRDIRLNTSTGLWNIYINWTNSYCNYQDSAYYVNNQSGAYLFNQHGASNMYKELMSYLTSVIDNKPLLSGLNTTDKSSLVSAINEINAKITSGTFATNLTEVQGYDATKTQVLKNVNGQFTWVDEN